MGDGNVIPVVPPCEARDTAALFRTLEAQAEAGSAIGAAMIVLGPGLQYEAYIVGIAELEPIYVAGLLMLLQRRLAKLAGMDG